MSEYSNETLTALLKGIKDSVEKQEKAFDDFVKEAPKLFASKLSEKIVYGLVGIVIITVVTAIVAGTVKATEWLIIL